MGKIDDELLKKYLDDPENVRLPDRMYRPPVGEDRVAKRFREEEEKSDYAGD